METDTNFHSTRRAYATGLARATVNAQTAQVLSGHSDANRSTPSPDFACRAWKHARSWSSTATQMHPPATDKLGKVLYYAGAAVLLAAALLAIFGLLSLAGDEVHAHGFGRIPDDHLFRARAGWVVMAIVFFATAVLNFYLLHTKPQRLARVIVPLEIFVWIPLVAVLCASC